MPSNFRVGGVDTDDIFIRRELFQEGGLWLWGRAQISGNLGDNTNLNRSSPVQTVSRGSNWFKVSMSRDGTGSPISTAAIKTDGTLWTWGSNDNGELGDNTIIARSSPVQVIGNATNWRQLSVGKSFIASIKTDGSLWVWGRNNYGQLGTNDTLHRSSPVQTILGGTNWKQVSNGQWTCAAIKTDGTLWTWGRNFYGQLGLNDILHRSTPIQILGGGTNWRQLDVGVDKMAAIKTDGTLWVWGRNYGGSLGDSSIINRSSPVQLAGTNWKQASAGNFCAAAVKTDGTLWTWGLNFFGSLGNNGTTAGNRSSPAQIFGGGTNWKQVIMPSQFGMAIKTDGTLWGWGANDRGELATGDRAPRSSPVQTVAGGTNWRQIAAGYQQAACIREDFY